MFPFELVGAIRLPPAKYPNGALAVVNRIAAALDEAQATEVHVEENTVRFRNDFIRPLAYRGNVLTPYGCGLFEVKSEPDAIRIRYALNMTRIVVPAAILVFVVFALLLWQDWLRSVKVLELLGAICLAGYVLNYTVSAVFFWIWLRWNLRGLRQLQEP